jgi:hypothetical protein
MDYKAKNYLDIYGALPGRDLSGWFFSVQTKTTSPELGQELNS